MICENCLDNFRKDDLDLVDGKWLCHNCEDEINNYFKENEE